MQKTKEEQAYNNGFDLGSWLAIEGIVQVLTEIRSMLDGPHPRVVEAGYMLDMLIEGVEQEAPEKIPEELIANMIIRTALKFGDFEKHRIKSAIRNFLNDPYQSKSF